MNSYRNARGLKRGGIWLSTALLVLLMVGSVAALDPVPDYKTLIMPTLVPKAGHGSQPDPGFEAGLIRNAYETRYEDYWQEVSYYQYDRSTGAKGRGYYNDTKTYGYAQVPWPLSATNAAGFDDTPVAAEDFEDGNRLYSANIPTNILALVTDGADSDGVWTPGESFEDVNDNGQWDPGSTTTNIIEEVLPEDYWESSNTNGSWGGLWYLFGLEGPTGAVWSTSGEFFADYNNSASIAAGYAGYESSSGVWIADPALGYNVFIPVNELDMNPTADGTDGILEGDFSHSYVDNGNPGGQASIATNGIFDYTVD